MRNRSNRWLVLCGVFVLVVSFVSGVLAESVTIQRDGVMLREGPGNFYKPVAMLAGGTSGERLESGNGWLKLRTGDLTGWVSDNALIAPARDSSRTFTTTASAGKVLPISVIVASIKGLTAGKQMPLEPGALLNPEMVASPERQREFRAAFTTIEGEPIQSVFNIYIRPEDLAIAGALAMEEVESLGGANTRLSNYATMVLLWLCDANEAYSLTPQVYVTNEGGDAHSYPGGTIIMGAELFSMMRDESELAAVLAHELAHVLKWHHLAAANREAWRVGVESAFSELEESTVESPFSLYDSPYREVEKELEMEMEEVRSAARRKKSLPQEIEADSLGVRMLLKAGYDPHALDRLLQRILDTVFTERMTGRGGISLAWINSRDELRTRIEKLKKEVKRLPKRKIKKTKRFEERFEEYTR